MTHPSILIARASLVGLGLGLMLVAIVMLLSDCAALSDAEKAGVAMCKLNEATHPPQQITAGQVLQATCDTLELVDKWTAVANLAAAKPTPDAAKEALAAHTPLSSAAALALPCIDLKNPYEEPQSRIDRKLYPYITTPPVPGE
jgi:hypothetical protein